MSRTKSSIRNFIFTIVSNFSAIVIGLISQKLFIEILGIEYMGINGLFTNIISLLGIVEMGVGTAIIYSLYGPLENDDRDIVSALMNFYKKTYNIIAFVVLLLGICITPFVQFFIKEVNVGINIKFVFIMFIIDIVCSYLLSYKRSILYADQKNYIINIVHIVYLVVMNFLQITCLYITKNYYVYLVIKIIMRISENIIISLVVNNKYSYLKKKNNSTLDKKIEKEIIKKVKSLFFHKIGGFVTNSTDNLIISKFLGLAVVGLYSNYYLIISSVTNLFGQAISAITPSIGHLLVLSDKKKNYEVFCRIRFANFWIATFSGTSILVLIQIFVQLWLGSEYVLPSVVIYVLVFNYFQKMMRNSYSAFKDAAGIFYEDRYVPILEAVLNIIFSIILVQLVGLCGVFIGTIISGLVLWCYSYPKLVYNKLFNRNYKKYIIETVKYILLFIMISVFTYILSLSINTMITSVLEKFFINMLICMVVPNSIIYFFFRKNDVFKYFANTFKSFLTNKIKL